MPFSETPDRWRADASRSDRRQFPPVAGLFGPPGRSARRAGGGRPRSGSVCLRRCPASSRLCEWCRGAALARRPATYSEAEHCLEQHSSVPGRAICRRSEAGARGPHGCGAARLERKDRRRFTYDNNIRSRRSLSHEVSARSPTAKRSDGHARSAMPWIHLHPRGPGERGAGRVRRAHGGISRWPRSCEVVARCDVGHKP
jgi:hypothetical protein